MIVRWSPAISASEREQILRRRGLEPLGGVALAGLQLVAGSRDGPSAARLARAEGVIYAEPDQYVQRRVLPADPRFAESWGLLNTGQPILGRGGRRGADVNGPAAWDVSTGSSTVVVAVVDSGIDLRHPDLAANLWRNRGEVAKNRIDDDGNGLVDDIHGWNFAEGGPPVDLSEGHGTAVAGVIGAVGNNSVGLAGMSWDVSLMGLRTVTLGEVIQAIAYARKQGARVLNFSGGFSFFSRALRDAIEAAPELLFVTAADNGGRDGVGDNADRVRDFPCKLASPTILCVAASDQRDHLTHFSNFGRRTVDLAAPGENVAITLPKGVLWPLIFESFDVPLGDRFRQGGRQSRWALTPKFGSSLTDSPGGRYRDRQNTWVTSVPLDLRDRRLCAIAFEALLRTELRRDRLLVEVSRDGRHWRTLKGFSGRGTRFPLVNIPARFNDSRAVRFRFRFKTDATVRADGVYIDGLEVGCLTSDHAYGFGDGTSFATPHVAGAAALMLARDPSLTMSDVRDRLLASAERLPALAGRLVSGGRLDAAAALR